MTAKQIWSVRQVFEQLNPIWGKGILHHGDCFGADAQAHILARKYGWRVEVHPPIKDVKRAGCSADFVWTSREYLDRNHEIVECTDRMVATPKGPEELRSGTWATIRYALKWRRMVYIVRPDGIIEVRVGGS